jgi:hypothetical protein
VEGAGRAGLDAGGFFAAASAELAGGAGRGVGAGGVAAACAGGGAAARAVGEAAWAPVPGSGFIMLTGGVEAELGNSALVGLPVGSDGCSAATGLAAGAATQDGAYRETRLS